jgi:alpha-galactosidase
MSVQDVYGTDRPFKKQEQKPQPIEEQALEPSGELAIPIMESITCGEHGRLDAINVPNRSFIPNLPDGMVVEVPATSDRTGVHPKRMGPCRNPSRR